MNSSVGLLIKLLLMFILSSSVWAVVGTKPATQASKNNAEQIPIIKLPEVDLEFMLEVFLLAVERGELQAMDISFERKNLIPSQVEIVYSLRNNQSYIKVISLVEPPIQLPHVGKAYITKISATLNLSGKIIDTAVHCDF